MNDVLAIVAPVPGPYPTFNTMWTTRARSGPKSQAYHDLFEAVKLAAECEILRTGWVLAEYPCAVSLTFCHRDARAPDASNLGKVECDALTAAGAWIDDKLARPVVYDTEHDPAGESRVVIVVRRRFPALVTGASPLLADARRKSRTRSRSVALTGETDALGQKWAWVDGKRVPYEQAMREIRAGRMR